MPRPHITCHMITTLGGRLRTDRWPWSEERLYAVYDAAAERLNAQGWIVGRASMEGLIPEVVPMPGAAEQPREDQLADRKGRAIGIIFDRTGRFLPESDEIEGDHLVMVLSERVADAHVHRLVARGISVVFSGPDGADVEGALARIAEGFGIERLVLEGGGTLNGVFLSKGLIDETSTLILPVIDGAAGAPAIFDFHGEIEAQALELSRSETLEEGVVWLRHRLRRP